MDTEDISKYRGRFIKTTKEWENIGAPSKGGAFIIKNAARLWDDPRRVYTSKV